MKRITNLHGVHSTTDLQGTRVAQPPATRLAAQSLRGVGLQLFAASFVVLFQELTLIRWLPGQVRVLAYFPNLILLSAFLGLGVGCLRASRQSLLWVWPASLVVVTAAGLGMSRIAFTQESMSEHLWLLYYDLPAGAPVINDVHLPIIVTFVLSGISFVPLGQIVAVRLQEFRLRSSALWGYCWDILGSLTGVVTFAAFGLFQTVPVVWFSVFLIVGLVFFTGSRRAGLAYAGTALATLSVVFGAQRADVYSPYYAITHRQDANTHAVEVLANGALHQYALSMVYSEPSGGEWQQTARDGYHVPYRMLPRSPKRVLVLGAGTGNDVAVALDEGAEYVDAVEIDPVILDLGRRLHPNRPYDSPRVRAVNTDARSFLNNSHDSYDLIVFGTLDSMTRLSALSDVRLDNFVYTVDALAAARAHLTPDGGIAMYFMVATDYIDQRLAGMLAVTFGERPIRYQHYHNLFNTIYMAGPAFAHLSPQERALTPSAVGRMLASAQLPSDDWPYLYLEKRRISSFYLVLMAILGTLSVLVVLIASREMRTSVSAMQIDGEMFCFGLAFLLLETKSVTALSLVWGATWLTSAVVFGSILFMVLLATVLAQLRPLPWPASIGGLVLSLLLTYATPIEVLLRVDTAVKLGLSALLVGVPIFFAAACFALLFKDREAADIAFGWNLLGAVAGGLLEYLSMAVGICALSLLALAAYLVAVLIRLRAEEVAGAPAWQPQAAGPSPSRECT